VPFSNGAPGRILLLIHFYKYLVLKKTILILAGLAALHCAQAQTSPIPSPAPVSQPSSSASAADVEKLRQQVEALTQTVGTLQKQLDSQQQRWDNFNTPATVALAPMPHPSPNAASASANGVPSPQVEQLQNDVDELKTAQRQAKTGMFNPDISAAVDFITSYSKKTNNVNFTPRDVELMVQSNVDQYAKAYIVFNAESELEPMEKRGLFEDTKVGVEEAAIQTTSLPWGLQLKGGQFFADFTRMDKVHSHDLPFVDRPRSLDEIIGGEAQARGFELTWLVPTEHYWRLTGGIVDNIGADDPITNSLLNADFTTNDAAAFADRENRPFQSLMAYGRAATLVDLSPGTVLHLGADYAKASQNTRRQIASADAKLEWQPDPAKYDLFETGGELLWTKQSGLFSSDALDAADEYVNQPWFKPSGDSSASGGYVYAQYRFGKLWQPGVRLDYTHTNTYQLGEANGDGCVDILDKIDNNIWTYSAYLTLNLSEFNRLRFQLNYVNASEDLGAGKGRNDLQAFFQWTIVLGAHKHDFAP
jgi:hypothetical protein